MGMLSSCIKKIDNTRFEALTPRPIKKVVGVVCIGSSVYVLGESGRVYTNNGIGGRVCLSGTDSDDCSIKALVALGVITKAEAEKHGEARRVRDRLHDIIVAAERDAACLKNIGIELTKEQRTRLCNLKKRVKKGDVPMWMSAKVKAMFTK